MKIVPGSPSMNPTTLESRHKITVIILTYNNIGDISNCISSVLSQTYHKYDVMVVDNASTDGTPEFIKNEFPQVKLIENEINLGYAGGNNVGFEKSTGKYIAVLNPDTVVDKNWLKELIQPMGRNPIIAVTVSKSLNYDNKDMIDDCGITLHFTGLSFARGLLEKNERFNEPEYIGGLSGTGFLIRKEIIEKLGGFDQDFFMYCEDTELSWRIHFAGYKILYVPTSLFYHKHISEIPSWKYFYLERNRYLMLLKHCSFKFLVLLAPALVLTEIVAWGFAILKGKEYVMNKLRAYWWILRNVDVVRKKHCKAQKNMHSTYREFLERLEWKIPFEQIIKNKGFEKIVSGLFNSLYMLFYWMLKKLIILINEKKMR